MNGFDELSDLMYRREKRLDDQRRAFYRRPAPEPEAEPEAASRPVETPVSEDSEALTDVEDRGIEADAATDPPALSVKDEAALIVDCPDAAVQQQLLDGASDAVRESVAALIAYRAFIAPSEIDKRIEQFQLELESADAHAQREMLAAADDAELRAALAQKLWLKDSTNNR